MTRRRIVIGLILLAAVVLGALREFLFLNLNYQIDQVENHRAFSYAHSAFQAVVKGWSLRSLVLLKWASALGCMAIMLGLSLAMSRQLFGDHRYRMPIVGGFLLLGSLALLLHLLAGVQPAAEGVSVKLLHVLQYPVILFFLWAAALLRRGSA